VPGGSGTYFPVFAPAGGGGGGGGGGAGGPSGPVPPAPAVPFFPAGDEPELSDFETWVYDNWWFLTTKVVFRGRQAVTPQSLLTANPLQIDTVDEDPYGGWSGSPNWWWTPPFSGWYQATTTGFMQTPTAGGDLYAVISAGNDYSASYQYPQQNVQTVHGQGTSGTFWFYLIGGEYSIAVSVQYAGSASAPETSVTAGQQSTLEIVWASL